MASRSQSRLLVFLLACLGVARMVAAGADTFQVGPWIGDNAIVPRLDANARNSRAVEMFRGSGPAPRVLSSLFPGERFSAEKRGTGWSLGSEAFGDKRSRWTHGAAMTLSFQLPGARATDKPSLVFTNVQVGLLWVARVAPALDSHELPPLTDAARRRVWVLVLTNDIVADARGRWHAIGDLEKSGAPFLCGLPRAFANAIVADPHVRGPVGLVLVPYRERQLSDERGWRRDRCRARGEQRGRLGCRPASSPGAGQAPPVGRRREARRPAAGAASGPRPGEVRLVRVGRHGLGRRAPGVAPLPGQRDPLVDPAHAASARTPADMPSVANAWGCGDLFRAWRTPEEAFRILQ